MKPLQKTVIAVVMLGSSLTGGAIGAAYFAGSSANAATSPSTTAASTPSTASGPAAAPAAPAGAAPRRARSIPTRTPPTKPARAPPGRPRRTPARCRPFPNGRVGSRRPTRRLPTQAQSICRRPGRRPHDAGAYPSRIAAATLAIWASLS